LIIVTGTPDEIRFVRDTVEALKQKAAEDRAHGKSFGFGSAEGAESKPHPLETKAP
jgi:hypothetical protein